MINIDKSIYKAKMAENLPVLRAKCGITQEQLGRLVDMSRQTVVAIETGKRTMTWSVFLAFLMIFKSNDHTKPILSSLGIYTEELGSFFAC